MNLIHEHACLLRRLAALQARVSEQMGALARERANTHVESTALRLKTGQQTSEDKPKIGRKR